MTGESTEGAGDLRGDGGGGVVAGQVDDDAVLSDALAQGDHRGGGPGAEDQVTFPMAGDDLVLDVGRALVDHHHVPDARGAGDVIVAPAVLADAATSAEFGRVALVQSGVFAVEQGAVDRLVTDPHACVGRVSLA